MMMIMHLEPEGLTVWGQLITGKFNLNSSKTKIRIPVDMYSTKACLEDCIYLNVLCLVKKIFIFVFARIRKSAMYKGLLFRLCHLRPKKNK
jgi:hypothetical protein